jgi:hypothetical protein
VRVGGAVFAAAGVLLSLALWRPEPLLIVPIGLLFVAAPLLAHLDAVELDGRWLRVRRGIRWVGPVDLDELVAFGFRPPTPRRPPVWLLIQRDAGSRFRWYWRWNVEPAVRDRLAGDRSLRVLEVAAGGACSTVPGLADHLARHVLRSDALVEARARAAFARLGSAHDVQP